MSFDVIWICGNMGSGKSTLCRELKKLLPQYTHMTIDHYRAKNISFSEEAFIDDLQMHDKILLDCVGKWGRYLPPHKKALKIKLSISVGSAFARVKFRIKNPDPEDVRPDYKSTLGEIKSLMKFIDKKIQSHHDFNYKIKVKNLSKEEVLQEVIEILKKEQIL